MRIRLSSDQTVASVTLSKVWLYFVGDTGGEMQTRGFVAARELSRKCVHRLCASLSHFPRLHLVKTRWCCEVANVAHCRKSLCTILHTDPLASSSLYAELSMALAEALWCCGCRRRRRRWLTMSLLCCCRRLRAIIPTAPAPHPALSWRLN